MEDPKPHIDPFGTERTPEGKPVIPEVPKEDEKKPEEKEDKTDDIESHPLVRELRGNIEKLDRDKSSISKNLSEQRKAFDRDMTALRKEVEDIKSGKQGSEPLFKDIKRVKDLPKDVVEGMTDAEKRLYDELADTREAMNKVVAETQAKSAAEAKAATDAASETAAKAEKEAEEEAAQAEFDSKVQAEALKLAGNDKDMANKIIAEFNEFAGNETLSDKALLERISKASKLVDGYQPPREQRSPRGTAAGATDNDQFGTDAIIQQVQSANKGGTYSL